MANFEDQLSMHDEPSAQEMEEMMSQKAHELFELCDKEQKGFITKRDMQRLQSELPLSPEQLEAVFDSLDDDRNGFLTLEEFTGGFGSFLGLNPSEGVHEEDQGDGNVYEEQDDAVEEDRQFHQMMSNLGATHLFDDENTIKSVWSRIRRNEPEVVSNFEDFLYKISNEIRKSKLDFNTLESALKSKSSAHDQEVQKLYEEMEYQIKAEKERVLTEEQTKERQLREAMEHEIKEKDKQLQELLMKHQEMEERLSDLNLVEVETKQENDKLMKDKESLEELLLKSEENLEESKAYINQLRSQQRDEKRERARAALKLTEGIALERESLVKQLDTLKHVNKKLRDDKDEAETRRTTDWANDAAVSIEEETKQILAEETTAAKQPSSRKKELCKQGSILGNYFGTDKRGWGATESLSEDIESDVEHDGDGTLGHHGIEGDDDVEIDDHEMDDSLNHTNQSQTFNHKHLTNENNAQLLAGQGSEYINGGPTSNKVRKTKKQGSLEDITSSENEAGTKQGGQQSDKSKSHMKKRKKHTSGRDDTRTTADDSQDSNVVVSQGLVGNSVDDDWEPDTDNIDIQTASALEEVSAEKNQPHDSLIDSHFSKDTPVASSFGEGEVTVDNRNENSNVTKSQIDETAGKGISDLSMSAELENMNKTLKQKDDIGKNELDTPNASVTSSKKTTGHLPKKSEKVARLAEIYENENSENWKNDNELSKSYEMKDMKGVDTHQIKTGVRESFDDSDHSRKSQADKKSKVKRKKKTYPCNSLPCARGVPMDTWSDELSFTEGSDSDEAVSMAALHNEQLRSRHRRYRKRFGNAKYHPILDSTTQRGQPVGADEDGTTDPRPPKRERLFKVVFVGDSGVGKSSFIHRFCNDQFNPSFSATIGVDFQVKSVEMEDQIIVLQLWDTAGQERFRSITKQYFRKADGVVVLYDVTSEASFISVKNWMVSVQDGVEEGTIILMVGNKTDLSENDDKRVVKLKDGSKLAMSYDALFYETSAKNGTNIKEAVEAMASLLKDKQDEDLEKALHLQDDPVKKKKGCCG